jgi:hypothetical protein
MNPSAVCRPIQLAPLACLAEKTLKQVEAFLAEHAGGDVAAVVERWVGLEQVDPAAGRAALPEGILHPRGFGRLERALLWVTIAAACALPLPALDYVWWEGESPSA